MDMIEIDRRRGDTWRQRLPDPLLPTITTLVARVMIAA
jgi:hypothetical protein